MSDLAVEYRDHAYWVMRGDEVASGPHSQARALESKERLERLAKQKRRKCKTCSDQFMSEGAHHRMCAKCRSGASAIFDGAV